MIRLTTPLLLLPIEPDTAIKTGMAEFESFEAESRETSEGRVCDRYRYVWRSGGVAPTIDTGELWFDPSEPSPTSPEEKSVPAVNEAGRDEAPPRAQVGGQISHED